MRLRRRGFEAFATVKAARAPPPRRRRPLLAPALELRRFLVSFRVLLPTALLQLLPLDFPLAPAAPGV